MDPSKVGFAASGGGYRAGLFHVGALWRLNELAWLNKIHRFSGVSGGSITLGRLAAVWPTLAWEDGVATNFEEQLALPLIEFFRSERLDVPAILHGLIPVLRRSSYVERVFRRRLVGAQRLNELPQQPQFTFNATSLQSGVSFRFTKAYVRDYRVGCLAHPAIPLAAAIAASAAFPPFLSPYRLHLKASPLQPVPGSNFAERLRTEVLLTDGGVYDNLGLQTLEHFGTVISSDAGAPGMTAASPSGFWPLQVLRVLGMVSEQTRARRRSQFFERLATDPQRAGTLWTLRTTITSAQLPPDGIAVLVVDPARQQELAATPTRLWPFGDPTTYGLVNLGYALADAGLRQHMGKTGKRPAWPFPQFGLESPPSRPAPVLAGAPNVEDA